ncbi:MAG TPA: YqaE/Pmp3 family membrane protein [Bacteroidales bacterium]|nr:YqaE/Pmp3 family membrane protein [Bacteroidales bacterium]
MKKLIFLVAGLLLAFQGYSANPVVPLNPTAEHVFAVAASMETFDADVLRTEMQGLSQGEMNRLIEMALADVMNAHKNGAITPPIGLFVLAVIFPPLAVGLYTNWGMPTLFNVLWCCLGYVPGIVHAVYILTR